MVTAKKEEEDKKDDEGKENPNPTNSRSNDSNARRWLEGGEGAAEWASCRPAGTTLIQIYRKKKKKKKWWSKINIFS